MPFSLYSCRAIVAGVVHRERDARGVTFALDFKYSSLSSDPAPSTVRDSRQVSRTNRPEAECDMREGEGRVA